MKAIHKAKNGTVTFEFLRLEKTTTYPGLWFVITTDSPDCWMYKLVQQRQDKDVYEVLEDAFRCFTTAFGRQVNGVQPVSVSANAHYVTDANGDSVIKLKSGYMICSFLVHDNAATAENLLWFRDNWTATEENITVLVDKLCQAVAMTQMLDKITGRLKGENTQHPTLPLGFYTLLKNWPQDWPLQLKKHSESEQPIYEIIALSKDSAATPTKIGEVTTHTAVEYEITLNHSGKCVRTHTYTNSPVEFRERIREGLDYLDTQDAFEI